MKQSRLGGNAAEARSVALATTVVSHCSMMGLIVTNALVPTSPIGKRKNAEYIRETPRILQSGGRVKRSDVVCVTQSAAPS